MEHGDRVVFVARPFLCCDYRSIIRTIFTRSEFIVIHLIRRSNRIDTSVNDHRFLLAFSLSLSIRPLSVDYYILLIVIKLPPNISITFLSLFSLSFVSTFQQYRESRIDDTMKDHQKSMADGWNHGWNLESVRRSGKKAKNIARLDSCRRRVEGTGENDEAADSTEPRDERIREAAASTRVSRTPVRQCSRPSSLHLEEGRSCPKVVPPGRGEGGTPRPPSSNKMEVFSRFQLRLPWSTHVVFPLLWSTSHCTKPSLSFSLSLPFFLVLASLEFFVFFSVHRERSNTVTENREVSLLFLNLFFCKFRWPTVEDRGSSEDECRKQFWTYVDFFSIYYFFFLYTVSVNL